MGEPAPDKQVVTTTCLSQQHMEALFSVCKHKPQALSFIYVLSLSDRNPEINILSSIINLYNSII